MLLFLVCEKRKEEMIDELVEFIYQLSVEDAEVAVETLKEPIHFVKGGSVTNLGTYVGPLFFSPYDSFYSSFLVYLLRLPHLSTSVSQTHTYWYTR